MLFVLVYFNQNHFDIPYANKCFPIPHVHRRKEHVRLIQLRNPWAKDTWLGRYNNKCPSWTEELRTELMVSGMRFSDALYCSKPRTVVRKIGLSKLKLVNI